MNRATRAVPSPNPRKKGNLMHSIVYIVGAVVIVMVVLSFLGLR
jgi:predicted nucleic acid-binding Zn ribbon protein